MSDLKMLEDLGVTLDPPQAAPSGRLRQRVLAELTQQPHRSFALPQFRAARFGWRLAAAGGLAAVLTAGILATQVLKVGNHAPTSNAQAANAAQILSGAALVAKTGPAVPVRDNQFIYVESITAGSAATSATESGGTVSSEPPKQRRAWLSVDGTSDGLVRTRLRSGAGGWSDRPLPGCHDGKMTQTKGSTTVSEPCTPAPGYRTDLPTDVRGMLDYLYPKDVGKPQAPRAFEAAADLLTEAYLQPATLAAVFGAVAKIPGVTVIGNVTDEAGRAGVAVSLKDASGTRTELIFNRTTHAYLGVRAVVLIDYHGLKADQVLYSAAVLTVAVVNNPGQLPH
jgi:hypothetical protein